MATMTRKGSARKKARVEVLYITYGAPRDKIKLVADSTATPDSPYQSADFCAVAADLKTALLNLKGVSACEIWNEFVRLEFDPRVVDSWMLRNYIDDTFQATRSKRRHGPNNRSVRAFPDCGRWINPWYLEGEVLDFTSEALEEVTELTSGPLALVAA